MLHGLFFYSLFVFYRNALRRLLFLESTVYSNFGLQKADFHSKSVRIQLLIDDILDTIEDFLIAYRIQT